MSQHFNSPLVKVGLMIQLDWWRGFHLIQNMMDAKKTKHTLVIIGTEEGLNKN